MFLKILISFIVLIQLAIFVLSKNDCIQKRIENSDTVCVCNSTYCDDFPPITRPKSGFVSIFESNKLGDRFFEYQQKFRPDFGSKQKMDENDITIMINEKQIYQKILGFGGGFTDSTGYMLNSVNQSLATAIIDSYFSSEGIEYSFGRVPAGATDYSVRPYSYDDVYDDKNLTYFSLQKEDLEYKIPYIKLAEKLSPHKLKLIGTVWSPPVWMKKVEELLAFSELKGEVGGKYYQILANYIVKFLEAYKENGINFWGMTTENEPAESHGNPCLKMTPQSLKTFVKNNLGPTLKSAGFDKTKLNLLLLDEGIPFIKNWTDIIMADNDMSQYISGVAVHWYYNEILGIELMEQVYDYMHNKYPNYFVLNTEACILDGAGHGNWSYAERYAFDIIKQLNHWAVGWIEWNMVLDMAAGPTWFERLGCGGPVYIDLLAGEAYKQPTFYALGHFSKFISPDSVRIGHELEGKTKDVYVLTVKRPDGAIVAIVLNRRNEEININIKTPNNLLTNKISAHSIQSYIWR